jgi:rRNA-processing protein FCF1
MLANYTLSTYNLSFEDTLAFRRPADQASTKGNVEMTNAQYTEKTIASVDKILVDTSTLMTFSFQQFIRTNKALLISYQKKIVVPKAVYTELARHVESSDPEKSKLAMESIELLTLNMEIFQIEDMSLTAEEVAHAFADAELLSELTLHRSDYSQLLITNDRRLSCDAFDLNQLESCRGRKIFVCYINWCGELQCCECARPSALKSPKDADDDIPVCDHLKDEEESDENKPGIQQTPWKFDWKSGIITASGLSILVALYKGGKELLKSYQPPFQMGV